MLKSFTRSKDIIQRIAARHNISFAVAQDVHCIEYNEYGSVQIREASAAERQAWCALVPLAERNVVDRAWMEDPTVSLRATYEEALAAVKYGPIVYMNVTDFGVLRQAISYYAALKYFDVEVVTDPERLLAGWRFTIGNVAVYVSKLIPEGWIYRAPLPDARLMQDGNDLYLEIEPLKAV